MAHVTPSDPRRRDLFTLLTRGGVHAILGWLMLLHAFFTELGPGSGVGVFFGSIFAGAGTLSVLVRLDDGSRMMAGVHVVGTVALTTACAVGIFITVSVLSSGLLPWTPSETSTLQGKALTNGMANYLATISALPVLGLWVWLSVTVAVPAIRRLRREAG